jgi:RNA polymerase sigma-70 factor (ECF subfamily)
VNVVLPRDATVIEAIPDEEQSSSASRFDAPTASETRAMRLAMESMSAPEKMDTTAEELARRAQAGCLDSFEDLVRRYEAQVFNFLRQFTRHQQDAEDLTQETFVKAYRSLHRYNATLAFAPWLFVIARRTAASHFRSFKHFEELQDDSELATEGNPASVLEQQDEQTSLWKLVRALKPKQAEAIWLRYAEGFSVAETARIMETNQVYVKVLLHRARSNLSKMLAARKEDCAQVKTQLDGEPTTFPKSKVVL